MITSKVAQTGENVARIECNVASRGNTIARISKVAETRENVARIECNIARTSADVAIRSVYLANQPPHLANRSGYLVIRRN